MGAWGVAIMSNDTSADVRDEFRDHVADGLDPEQATAAVLETFAEDLADDEAAADVWLGLAAAQWQSGRLVDRVRDEALALIDGGADLERWQRLGAGRATLRRRAAALAKLRDQLAGPPRAPSRIRRRYRVVTEYRPGDVLTFRYGARTAVLLVTSLFKTPEGLWPVVLVAPDVPELDVSQQAIERMPLLTVDFAKAESWIETRPEYPPVREIARVHPDKDAVYVAGETSAPEAPCLVALFDGGRYDPADAAARAAATEHVGRWVVPEQVLGVLRTYRWQELADYLDASRERGYG